MAEGEGFDRCVVSVFRMAWELLFSLLAPFRWKLNRAFLVCNLYVKLPDRDKEYQKPFLIRRRKTEDGYILHLQVPPGLTPQDLEKAQDRLGFILGGKIHFIPQSPNRMDLVVVTKGNGTNPAAGNTP